MAFGQAISNYEAIQWMLADSATELDAARMLMLKAADARTRNPRPTLEEIKVGLDGNLCRCTGYTGIFEAIQACAARAK